MKTTILWGGGTAGEKDEKLPCRGEKLRKGEGKKKKIASKRVKMRLGY